MSQVARSTTISKENARSCLEAAGAAYQEDDKTLSCVADGCKVCVTIESERMIIAFRGTDNLENFFTDLDIKLIPYLPGQGHVHQGFFKAFQALQPLLDDVLQPGKILLFTGHSLGGALATLSALHAAASGRSIQCVTFGCPKVGDEDFARFYMQQVPQTCRYVNKFDPVPRLLHNSARPRDDADLFHWMLSKLIKSPQAQLAGGEYAHVCDAVQLDSGAMSSVNHWRAVAACVGWLTGRAGEDRRQEAWRKALVPHDVSIYKQNFEQKPSFNFDSMNMKDLQLLLQIVRRCPSPMLVAAAAAAGLAILMLWRMKATEAASPELRRWETELQTAADSRSCDASQAQLELDLAADKEDLCQQLDVLCRATAAAIQAAPGEGDPLHHLDPWRRLAPLIGRFLWNSSSWPGEWLELLPSIHHFQDLALDMEGEATLAWAPDSFEARVTLAFSEKLRGNQLPEAAREWFTSYGLLVPELPKCLEALDYDSPESNSRRTAVKTMVALMAEFMHSWPPALLVATLRRINRIAATDSNKEVRDFAAESLAEANSLVGLRPLLSCSQHQDPKLRRHATKLLKDIWEHSLLGPGWVIEELQQLHFDAHYSDAAEEALSYLRSQSPELVELLHDPSGLGVFASGASMAAPVAVD